MYKTAHPWSMLHKVTVHDTSVRWSTSLHGEMGLLSHAVSLISVIGRGISNIASLRAAILL